ncbi:unnamed protein product, partial [Ectocarpus sp. 12 AP-2014]
MRCAAGYFFGIHVGQRRSSRAWVLLSLPRWEVPVPARGRVMASARCLSDNAAVIVCLARQQWQTFCGVHLRCHYLSYTLQERSTRRHGSPLQQHACDDTQ